MKPIQFEFPGINKHYMIRVWAMGDDAGKLHVFKGGCGIGAVNSIEEGYKHILYDVGREISEQREIAEEKIKSLRELSETLENETDPIHLFRLK